MVVTLGWNANKFGFEAGKKSVYAENMSKNILSKNWMIIIGLRPNNFSHFAIEI